MAGTASVPPLGPVDRAWALRVMRRWAAAHPRGDSPQWLSERGELISPRRLVEGMECNDDAGEWWFRCLAAARAGVAPVSFENVLRAHDRQAAEWESGGTGLG
jgi:hypothetical protein